MKLQIDKNPVELLEGEHIEYHDGRTGYPFNLDCSIVGIQTEDRGIELKDIFTKLYPYPKYKMEGLHIVSFGTTTWELLFSISDFTPFIVE